MVPGGRTPLSFTECRYCSQFFTSYLSKYFSYVATAEEQSPVLAISAGIPQGEICSRSPLLFYLYIRLLPSSLLSIFLLLLVKLMIILC